MSDIFLKTHPFDSEGRAIRNYCFNITNGLFVHFDPRIIKGIEDKKYFILDKKGKPKKQRIKKDFNKLIAEEHYRDNRSLKRRAIEKYTKFELGTLIVNSQPHPFVYKTKCPVRHKEVYDVLNSCFILMTIDQYKKEKLDKINRGILVEKQEKGWKKIGQNGSVKFGRILGEIEAQKVHEDVGENLLLWKSRLKYNSKCARCVFNCKQAKVTHLYTCKKYKSSKQRKSRK